MLRSLHRRLSYANVMATVAVFIALGGSSYATLRITSRNVPKNALTGADIKNLTGKDVRNNSLTGADVRNKSLTPKDFRGSVRGPQGPPGHLGATGAKGDKGDPGPRGLTGPANWAAVREVNNVVGVVEALEEEGPPSFITITVARGDVCKLDFPGADVVVQTYDFAGHHVDRVFQVIVPGRD